MTVADAVRARKSVRAYLDRPVETDLLLEVFTQAGRAASGGNLQPWKVHLLNGQRMQDFHTMMAPRIRDGLMDAPEYPVYPAPLKEPYRSRRFAVGEAMYTHLGVGRDDKAGRLNWFARNYRFFDAPAAALIFVDRDMGAAQWTDLGGYLATVMLLAREQGLGTCAQEAWCVHHSCVAEFVRAPTTDMLFCGIAIGHEDTAAAINQTRTTRAPTREWLFLA